MLLDPWWNLLSVIHWLEPLVGGSDVFIAVIKHHDQGNQPREEFVLVSVPESQSPQWQGGGSGWAWVLKVHVLNYRYKADQANEMA